MGLAEAIAGLVAVVEGVTPPTAATYRFTRHPPQSRGLLYASTRTRTFDVGIGAPRESDRTTDGTVDYLVADMVVEVVYPLAAWRSRDELHAAMSGDAAALTSAIRPPSAWSTWAHELYVLGGDVGRDEVAGTDGEPVAYVLSIPLTVHTEV